MNWLINIAFLIAAFVLMEFVAWFTHKFVMHGFLWSLHEDHHVPDNKHFFEKNDYFFLIFAIPGASLFYYGLATNISLPYFWIGLGITIYGLCYFLVHDVFIHQRFSWFKKTDNFYFKAIRRAHKIHHKHLSKEKGECFGMLFVPFKYFKEFSN